MRRGAFVLLAFVLSVIFGCGGQPTNLNPKPAPTGGAMVRLPKDRGFVAIKTEGREGARKSQAKNQPVSIVAYFYQMDGTTPMAPAPTDVVFKIGVDEKAKPVSLTPDAKDPNRFLSEPGPYAKGIQGMIQAKIQGEDVQESFSSL